jgi:uncharacterized low-complexity protein
MSRKKLCTVVAGWLAATSVGVAQSRQAPSPKPLSPYYPTASTVDRRGGEEASDMPPEMPSMPVPRASFPARSMSMMQPPPAAVAPSPAAAAASVAPVGPAAMNYGANAGCGPNGCGPTGAANCNNGSAGCEAQCGADERLWVSVEFLEWWTKGMGSPALVTGSPPGTPLAAAGVLGAAGTVVLAGDGKFNSDNAPGFRLRTGFWIDSANACGVEGSYFFLGRRSDDHTHFATTTIPIMARPFFDAAPAALVGGAPTPSSVVVTFPGLASGIVTTNADTEFYGFDANFRKNCVCSGDHRIDFVAGYRYLRLNDTLQINENVSGVAMGGGLIPFGTQSFALPFGSSIFAQDRFDTRNDFNGGQVGFVSEWRSGRLVLGARGLIAVGNTHKEASVSGSTAAAIPGIGAAQTFTGVLAQPTNIGNYERNEFAYVPEGSVTVGLQVTDGFRVFLGYTFIYWSNVWRAGDQVDLTINTTQLGTGPLIGAPRPQFPAKDSDFWAQGVSAGLELRY